MLQTSMVAYVSIKSTPHSSVNRNWCSARVRIVFAQSLKNGCFLCTEYGTYGSVLFGALVSVPHLPHCRNVVHEYVELLNT